MVYNFILNMWVQNRITAEKVNAFVGKCITQEQANGILATAQTETSV